MDLSTEEQKTHLEVGWETGPRGWGVKNWVENKGDPGTQGLPL